MQKGSYEPGKHKDKGENLTKPPAQETDSHKPGGRAPYEDGDQQGKKGDTAGNKNIPIDRSHQGGEGGKGLGGDKAAGGLYQHDTTPPKSPFLGETKGNKDLPINRTSGVDSKEGGRYIASNDRYHGGRKQSPEGN